MNNLHCYQPVNIGKYARTTGDDPIRKILKLEGMSYQNETISRSFDPSGNVKGVRFKLDGTFVKSTRLFDDAMIQADLDHVKTLIREATSAILEGDFCINPLAPKRNQSISASCEYCNYQGLCYLAAKNDEEIEILEESLGEDE